MIQLGFSYDRRALPEQWERELWSIAPPSEQLTWLKLWHVPGDPWEPIDRWFIYQMRAPRLIANRPDLLRELRGPHPRSRGHYCADNQFSHCGCRKKLGMWREGAARQISRDTWELFQATGHYGKPWWVIQGDQGGHRFQLDKIESKVSRIMGGPSDTPVPGALPYAEWDQRVFKKILHLDRVRMWKHVTDYAFRNHGQMDAEEEQEARLAREAMWGWLESQCKATVEKIGKSACMALKDAQRNETMTKDEGRVDLEGIQRDFIETAA